MKNSPNFIVTKSGAFFTIVTIVFCGLVLGCEPETVESPEMILNLEMNNSVNQPENSMLNKQIAELRAYVAPYHNMKKALEDGYVLDITGYMSQMGNHYLKAEYLDANFELLQPEILIYAPGPKGTWRLVGVEYATTIEDMDNPPPAPEGFIGGEDEWAINDTFEVWTLHVWVGLNNPNGIFVSHNPRLP